MILCSGSVTIEGAKPAPRTAPAHHPLSGVMPSLPPLISAQQCLLQALSYFRRKISSYCTALVCVARVVPLKPEASRAQQQQQQQQHIGRI